MKRKTTSRSRLVKRLDQVFSQWVRLSAADAHGRVRCFTCDAVRYWSEVDNGHFMSRACMSTRWEPRNCAPQCKRCNGFRSGEQYIYGQRLDLEYGEGTAERMVQLSKQTKKWSAEELKALILHYTQQVDELRAEKGV